MPLSDVYLRKLKKGDKAKHHDEGGLYLFLSPVGGKLWRMDYTFEGKRKTLSLGKYPAVGLKEARTRRDTAKTILATGIDPSAEKKRVKVQAAIEEREQALTFEAVSREWWEVRTIDLAESSRRLKLARLEKHVFPFIGNKSLSKIEFSDLVSIVRTIEDKGRSDMPRRVAQIIGQVCKFARQMQYTKENLSADLVDVLKPVPQKKHRAALTSPDAVGELLRRIDASRFRFSPGMACALWLVPYTFLRSQELRGARWEEIDLGGAMWHVPAERMKMKRAHEVPLARQVVEKLRELKKISSGPFLFPSGGKSGFITAEGLRKTLIQIGYAKEEICIHGLRATVSTLLNESGKYRPDVIETQLAHSNKDAIRAAYNHAQYIPERRKMMQEWADYLDSLRAGE